MKKLSIYIDYAKEDEAKFAKKLKPKLKNIDGIEQVILYDEIKPEDLEDWESETIKSINSADIVIPILTEEYLDFVSDKVGKKFDNIISSKDKFLFPILFTQSEWGSFNWVVKSKLIPSDGQPLSSYSKDESEQIVNGLIKLVKNIILRNSTESKQTFIERKIIPRDKIVFISHDHEDADFAELLQLKLEKNGLTGWIDSERLKIGQDWREEIDQGIENSMALVAIMTPNARKSEYVTYEWAFAWGKSKKIFPIMLKQTQLHPRLESLQYLDFTNRASRPWDGLIESINEVIKNSP